MSATPSLFDIPEEIGKGGGNQTDETALKGGQTPAPQNLRFCPCGYASPPNADRCCKCKKAFALPSLPACVRCKVEPWFSYDPQTDLYYIECQHCRDADTLIEQHTIEAAMKWWSKNNVLPTTHQLAFAAAYKHYCPEDKKFREKFYGDPSEADRKANHLLRGIASDKPTMTPERWGEARVKLQANDPKPEDLVASNAYAERLARGDF
jgi:hypothetical protein